MLENFLVGMLGFEAVPFKKSFPMLHGCLLIVFLAFSALYAGNPPPKSVQQENDYEDDDEEDEDVLLLEEDVDDEYEPHN